MTLQFRAGAHVARAKVYVTEVGQKYGGRSGGGDYSFFQQGEREIREVVTFSFVSGNDPDSENAKFWKASPEAQPIQMTIANPQLHGVFKPGNEYYLDFVEAVREESA